MRAARAGLALASFAIAFAAAEIVVRGTPAAYSTGFRPASNSRLVYELEPGHVIASFGGRVSAQGLYDREYPLAKPEGAVRIALVGDSTAFGWRVSVDESFAKVLERRLNETRIGRFEVINFSVLGYNTAQELEVIRDKVLAFEPDIVLLVFNGNDVHLCNYIQPEPTWLGMLAHRSYLLHLLVRWIDVWLATPNGGNHRFPPVWTAFKRDGLGMRFAEQLYYPRPGLEETTYRRAGNPPMRAGYVPERYRYMLGYPSYRRHLAAIRDLLAERGITLVSTGPFSPEALRINRGLAIPHVIGGLWPANLQEEFGEADALLLPNDGHWNARGHALAAEYVLRRLAEQGLVGAPKAMAGSSS